MKEKFKFWFVDNNKIKIKQTKLIEFIESEGFRRLRIGFGNYILVRENNNLITKVSEADIVTLVSNYLKGNGEFEVYETFAKGISSYIYGRKIDLIQSIDFIDDRDHVNLSRFYFKNGFVVVTNDSIEFKSYEKLEFPIWEDRIIQRDFQFPNKGHGQFEQFCINITHDDYERFVILKSLLGYLLHRNKENGETVAIILYDENMGQNQEANGGTGKTLLCQALEQCRELVLFNGKEIKEGSWFKNQQIELTTDILLYDDLKRGFSLENFFPILTTGVEVEKKRQQSFTIDFNRSPKVAITSNYVVNGPGGSSDRRRRYEFELFNYYNAEFRPEDEFKCRFFNNLWSDDEWNSFYFFMMECVQTYLRKGLIKAEPINLKKSGLIDKTSAEFYEFAEAFIKYNIWTDKREFEEVFKEWYGTPDISSHQIAKWIKTYSNEMGAEYDVKSSGGNYEFILRLNEVDDGNRDNL